LFHGHLLNFIMPADKLWSGGLFGMARAGFWGCKCG
jgi:hypothetical protein